MARPRASAPDPGPTAGRRALGGGLLLLALAAAAPAPAASQSLSIGAGAPPTAVDPHYHTLTPNFALGTHVFDTLVGRDALVRPVPGLAESWRALDERNWEFRLRQGVRWHNGEPFTAEDVAYTIRRVPAVLNSPGSYSVYVRAIEAVEVVDAHTIRFRTAGPSPLLPTDLSQVAIIWRGLGEGVTTGDFNSGRAAIGTGPYRLVSYQQDSLAVLRRNEDYWGEKPHWRDVNMRFISNDGARVAALRAGDVQLIDNVPTGDIARLRAEPRLRITEAASLRSVYLRPDLREGPSPYVSGPNGEALADNPLRDRRVREALSIAINRPAIAERTMSGAAVPTGQFMPAGTYGHVADLAPPPSDPERARRLLAEAGHAQGLTITLLTPNDRYVNDSQIAQTVAQMWSRIGVRTRVDAIPFAVSAQRIARFDTSMALGGWSNTTGEPSAGLRALLGTRDPARGWGTVNHYRYSNPAYDALVQRGLETGDDEAREALFGEATRLAAADFAWIPLHHQRNVWAMRDNLAHTPRADEMTRAMDVAPR